MLNKIQKFIWKYLSEDIKQSLLKRQQIRIPSVKKFILSIVILLLLYIVASIVIAPSEDPDFHFSNEAGAITALSAIMLSITSGLAWVVFFLSNRNNLTTKFWLLVSLGFGFFALDELLEFHERLDNRITASAIGASETFRNWNDLIVIAYGIVAILILLYFLSEILRYPLVAEMLSVAFLCYCIHTLLDSTLPTKSYWGRILEESAKVFSSSFFAISMFVGLLGVISSKYSNQNGDRF